MINGKELELYFHIPFCVRKCKYCDFLSFPLCGPDAHAMGGAVTDAYMEALMGEVRGRALEGKAYRVVSLFVGGGTPSLVKTSALAELMRLVRDCFCTAPDMEATIEVNPGTVDGEKLQCLHDAGFNRLSIGLQSAREEELELLGRIHTYQEFLHAYGDARAAGFGNINVDVMSGLPGQSLDSCVDTLRHVLVLAPPPEHISAYSLIVEEGTPFARMRERGELPLPDEDLERRMYEETGRLLEDAGYRRYEISNYAKEGFACRHNCGYWQRRDYLGMGLGAASLMDNVRFRNGEGLGDYLEDPLGQRCEVQRLTRAEQMEEFLFLGLRMTSGVSGRAFAGQFGSTLEEVYGDVIQRNIADGLLQRHQETGGTSRIALTKRGMDISNYVMAQFLTGT